MTTQSILGRDTTAEAMPLNNEIAFVLKLKCTDTIFIYFLYLPVLLDINNNTTTIEYIHVICALYDTEFWSQP